MIEGPLMKWFGLFLIALSLMVLVLISTYESKLFEVTLLRSYWYVSFVFAGGIVLYLLGRYLNR
jgi:hypothetical protein